MEPAQTLIEKTAFLKGVNVLSGVPSEALLDLAMRAKELHLDPGQVLIHEGDANQGVYLVMEGILEQRRREALIRIVRPREAVGELYLQEGDAHLYTVRALVHAHVLHLALDDVFDSISEQPELAVAMVRGLSYRMHELTTRVLDLEELVTRLVQALRAAGVEPPDLSGVAEPADAPEPGAPH